MSESSRRNDFGQPIGREVSWTPVPAPSPRAFHGSAVRLEPLTVEHAAELYDALGNAPQMWTYLSVEPPADVADMVAIIEQQLALTDALPFLVRSPEGVPLGTLAYLRVQPAIGAIEVGWVTFGPALQRTRAATEAQYLLMRHAFDDLGYRRYEWKCDSLNAPSRRAATRLGFVEEGTWRNALITKGRNRDTTWFSITVEEWPGVKAALESWLADDNFENGRQLHSLAVLRSSAR